MLQCLSFCLHQNFEMETNQSFLKTKYLCLHPVDNGKFVYDSLKETLCWDMTFFDFKKCININHGHNLSLALRYFVVQKLCYNVFY